MKSCKNPWFCYTINCFEASMIIFLNVIDMIIFKNFNGFVYFRTNWKAFADRIKIENEKLKKKLAENEKMLNELQQGLKQENQLRWVDFWNSEIRKVPIELFRMTKSFRLVAENSWNDEQRVNLHYQQLIGSVLNRLEGMSHSSQSNEESENYLQLKRSIEAALRQNFCL